MKPIVPLLGLGAALGAFFLAKKSSAATAVTETIPTGPVGPAPVGPSAQAGPPVSAPPKFTPAPPVASTTPTIRSGASGAAVTRLQTLLNNNGASLKVDGKFGALTDAAVRAYQSSRGLKVDGIVGPATWQALLTNAPIQAPMLVSTPPANATTPVHAPAPNDPIFGPDTRPTLRSGSSGMSVVNLQMLLNQHGAALEQDGKFGPQTLSAVKSFQSGHHLSADGVVGPKTWDALLA